MTDLDTETQLRNTTLDKPSARSNGSCPVPSSIAELEDCLSQPTAGALKALERLNGDILVLGVGGKIGPSLARMIRRGFDELGRTDRVIGAARFSNPELIASLNQHGIETVQVDLMDRDAIDRLPHVENVIFMAGFKFGATQCPERTWAMNVLAPAWVAESFAGSRQLVYSTGCVYSNVPAKSSGSLEDDPLEPIGEYANTCIGRERVFEWFAGQKGSPLSIYRLNYAVDLRYGVLVDIAEKVATGKPVDVTMGYANVIWQGDANARAIQCLQLASIPPFVVNITGPEKLSVREVAHRFGELLGRKPVIVGEEGPTALLSDAGLSQRLFGPPEVCADRLIEWVAAWLLNGRPTLGKPTHFEVIDGRY